MSSIARVGLLGVLAAALCAVAVPATVGARKVVTGGAHKVAKQAKQRFSRAYYASWMGDLDVNFSTLTSGTVKVGDKFEVIDEQGYLGRVTVTRVDSVAGGGSCVYDSVSASYAQAPGRPVNTTMVALGPAGKDISTSKVIRPLDVLDPPAYGTTTLDFAIDFDGDRRPEVAHYYYNCKAGPSGQTYSYDGDWCYETWTRESSWQLMTKEIWPVCY